LVSFSPSSCISLGSQPPVSHLLDITKITTLNDSYAAQGIKDALDELSSGRNIRIKIINISDSSNIETIMDVAAYDSGGVWTTSNDPSTIDALVDGADSVYYAERMVGVLPEASTQVLTQACNFTADSEIEGAPAVGDLEGDGDNEIVFASEDGVVYALYSNCTQIWSYTTSGFWQPTSPALADIDDNNLDLEVIIGDDSGILHAIDSDGDSLWNTTLDSGIQASVAIGDVDGDFEPEIAIASRTGYAYLLEHDKTQKWNYTVGCQFRSSPAIADVDNDGSLDIVFATEETLDCDDSRIFALNSTGGLIWEYNLTTSNDHLHSSPAVYDLDGDNFPEVIFTGCESSNCEDTDGYLYAIYGKNGTEKWKTPGVNADSSPAVADLDSDDDMEIVVGERMGGTTRAFYSNGTEMWPASTGRIEWSSPAIGDVDGDCNLEVAIVSQSGTLYILNGEDGSQAANYSVSSSPTEASPVIADVDGDNNLEIVVGSLDNILYVFDTLGSNRQWPTFQQCNKRAGYYYDSDCGGSISTQNSLTPGTNSFEAKVRVYLWT
jgi:predicted nucleotidyltransferase